MVFSISYIILQNQNIHLNFILTNTKPKPLLFSNKIVHNKVYITLLKILIVGEIPKSFVSVLMAVLFLWIREILYVTIIEG